MESSKQPNKLLYDEIRNIWVSALPEEIVRQKLLQRMLHGLNYPRELLSVEKELAQLPHLQANSHDLPTRRADILCFGKGIHPQHSLYPLLLIECKEGPLEQKALDQVIGYNHFVRAFFVAVANNQEVRVGHYSVKEKSYRFVSFLPSYNQLLNAVASAS